MKIFYTKRSILAWPILILVTFSLLFLPFEALMAERLSFEKIEVIYNNDESVSINWRTNVSTRGTIRFGVNSGNLEHYISESNSKSMSRWHETRIANLRPDSMYYYTLEASNGTESIKTFVRNFDTEDFDIEFDAPQLEDIEVFYTSSRAAAIRWNTDVSATSYVEYGIGAEYKKKKRGGRRTTKHLAILTKLEPDTEYYVKVYSVNKENQKSSEYYHSFKTLRQGAKNEGDLFMVDFKPMSASDPRINVRSITFDFDTNNLASGYVKVSSKGSKNIRHNFSHNTKHHLFLQDLVPNRCYDFDFVMNDIFKNRYKEKYTFCTRKVGEEFYQVDNKETIYTEYDLDKGQVVSHFAPVETEEEVLVLGMQYSHFTQVNRLLKTADSPKIYAIMNDQRHQVLTPEALADYGLNFGQVKTVPWSEIAQYKTVRLLKSAETDKTYFLWQLSDGSSKKILLPSPSIFASYPRNDWADVVKISKFDLSALPDVKLVRTEGSADVYFLSDGKKHFVSSETFSQKGFSQAEVLVLNQAHLDAITEGEYYK